MRNKITLQAFNDQLRALVHEAVEDNQINVFELIGSLQVAQMSIDRQAFAAAQRHQVELLSSKIVPAGQMPNLG